VRIERHARHEAKGTEPLREAEVSHSPSNEDA